MASPHPSSGQNKAKIRVLLVLLSWGVAIMAKMTYCDRNKPTWENGLPLHDQMWRHLKCTVPKPNASLWEHHGLQPNEKGKRQHRDLTKQVTIRGKAALHLLRHRVREQIMLTACAGRNTRTNANKQWRISRGFFSFGIVFVIHSAAGIQECVCHQADMKIHLLHWCE